MKKEELGAFLELGKLLSIHKALFLLPDSFLQRSLKGSFLDYQRVPRMIEITGLQQLIVLR